MKAVLVQANIALFEPGDEDLPCLVLFTFDENFHEDRLHRWASELSAYKNTESDDPEIAAIAEITTDERFYFDKRWTLPRSLVGWHDVYAGGLYVHRRHLPNGFIDTRTLWCLAEPGEKGMIIHIESQD